MPTGGAATGAEVVVALTRIVDELGRVVMLGVVMTMAVAGAASRWRWRVACSTGAGRSRCCGSPA